MISRIRRLKALFSSSSGVAGVEFAMVLPILAAIVVTLPDISQAAMSVMQMEGAARASIQYAMGGGTDMTMAQTVGLHAWSEKPANAALAASQSCRCAGAPGTCGQSCPDGSVPQTYFSVTASGHMGGSVISFDKSITRTVRLQ
jgi:Flp pilus assembly protein TadG